MSFILLVFALFAVQVFWEWRSRFLPPNHHTSNRHFTYYVCGYRWRRFLGKLLPIYGIEAPIVFMPWMPFTITDSLKIGPNPFKRQKEMLMISAPIMSIKGVSDPVSYNYGP